MIVGTTTWQLAGLATPSSITVQNVGISRIAYVFAASLPAVDAFDLDTDEHFIMNPGHVGLSFSNLLTESKSLYVRALGSKDGELAVDSFA